MQCLVDNIAFGGDGVARKDGLVIFVPFTLPSETVEVTIRQKKSSFAKADLQNIIEASPHRISAPCPYFTRCGGCQLQHASYSHQLEIKRRFVEDSLLRIGKISFAVPPIIGSEIPFAYRRHISLPIPLIDNVRRLCFTSIDGSFLPVNSCLLFHSSEDPILSDLQNVIRHLDIPPSCEARAKLIKTEKGYVITFSFNRTLATKNIDLLLSCKSLPSVEDVILHMPGRPSKYETPLTFICNNLTFTYSPFSFLQNHEEQSTRIYLRIIELLKNADNILDLYCGIGVSTLLLAKTGKKVTGIELNPTAVKMAKANADYNNLSDVSFICSSADTATETHIKTLLPDALLVNPPKEGLSSVVKNATAHPGLQKIVYVSCHPPTLARDLADLQKQGFVLHTLESFDMFPQTTHVETVAVLVR